MSRDPRRIVLHAEQESLGVSDHESGTPRETILTERIVKLKSAWRGIKIFCSRLSAFKAFNRYAPFKSFKTSED
jgi:hypothetical protein